MGQTGQREDRSYEVPDRLPSANHGNTVAAWTLAVVVMLGALVAAIAMIASQPPYFWVGLGISVFGLILGGVLRLAGWGQGGSRTVALEAKKTK